MTIMYNGTQVCNKTVLHQDVYYKIEHYVEAYVETTILGFGVIFNIINLLVLENSRTAETFRAFLKGLTVSDLGMCIFGIAQLSVESSTCYGIFEVGYWYGGKAIANHILLLMFLIFQVPS